MAKYSRKAICLGARNDTQNINNKILLIKHLNLIKYQSKKRLLAIRAAHLEVASTLDTDTCIHTLRRFLCRQGQVSSLRSDNATNFVGAERELREAHKGLNQNKIQSVMHQDGIEWNFNPPAGSHHGGVWE